MLRPCYRSHLLSYALMMPEGSCMGYWSARSHLCRLLSTCGSSSRRHSALDVSHLWVVSRALAAQWPFQSWPLRPGAFPPSYPVLTLLPWVLVQLCHRFHPLLSFLPGAQSCRISALFTVADPLPSGKSHSRHPDDSSSQLDDFG